MATILFNHHLTSQVDIEQHTQLIHSILASELRFPQIKKLSGIKYQKKPVYRAKIDDKHRMIFTYQSYEMETRLFILAINNHNYNLLKRQLKAEQSAHASPVELAEQDIQLPQLSVTPETLQYVPAVSYDQKTFVLDEGQQQGLRCKAPFILFGPPGSGKTVVLYQLMLSHFKSVYEVEPASSSSSSRAIVLNKSLFLSPSPRLVDRLRALYKTEVASENHPVQFSTWQQLLQEYYPTRSACGEEQFTIWLKTYFPNENAKIVHYELSLIKAMGKEHYFQLGERQCYFFYNPEKKQAFIKLLDNWEQYLIQRSLFDPMITVLKSQSNQPFRVIFCDETQNLPPVALASLIPLAFNKQFIASLDSEQCLISSPYIHNCLKELFFKHFGPSYEERSLPKTWRCPATIIETANHLMNAKYQLDNKMSRRKYRNVESALNDKKGIVSWIDSSDFVKIKSLGTLSGTVVISAHEPTLEEQAFINTNLGNNHILRAKDAIGLDFDTVVLWEPFTQVTCLHSLAKKNKGAPLTLEQCNALNALYVSLTRAQSAVFIYDSQQKRWDNLARFLLGSLPVHQTEDVQTVKRSQVEEQQRWEAHVEHHLAEGRIETAKELMRFHLNMDDKAIHAKLNIPFPKIQPSLKSSSSKTKVIQSKTQVEPLKIEKSLPIPKLQKAVTVKTGKDYKHPSQKVLGYMDKILANPCMENLLHLFKSAKRLDFLFGYEFNDGSCLFNKLLIKQPEALLKLTTENLNDTGLREKLTPEYLCSNMGFATVTPLYFFSVYESKFRLIKKLAYGVEAYNQIDIASSFYKKFDLGALCRVHSIRTAERVSLYTSAFFWLSTTEQGIYVLEGLFRNQYKLANTISVLELCRVISSDIQDINGTSILYWLTFHRPGLEFLRRLFHVNPFLIKNLNIEVLCKPLSASMLYHANASPLYWLSTTPRGIQTIQELLLAYNSNLIKGIHATDLCRIRPQQTSQSFANTSILFYLSSCPEGIKILTLIFTEHPELLLQIEAESLFVLLPNGPEKYSNTTAFFWLSYYATGQKLLNQLFNTNPALIESLKSEDLLRTYIKKDQNEWVNTSSLYWLSLSKSGLEFLLILLKNKPSLAKDIHSEDLLKTGSDESFPNYSVLAFLCSSILGRELFLMLLESNPDLAKGLEAQHFSLALDNIEDKTALKFLLCAPDGKKLRERLSHLNPELVEMLNAPSSSSNSEFFGSSVSSLGVFSKARSAREEGIESVGTTWSWPYLPE